MSNGPSLKQLSRYKVLGELGRGAMGVVYRAHDPALDRMVAIKTILLPPDKSERASYEARFLQEARAAGRLAHPGIITIYDVGRVGDLAYIAMEILEGTDLRERLTKGPLPPRAAGALGAQLADAFAFAHELGVVHRDIKPANIMLLAGDRAKIMDFGVARLQASDVKTQTGVLLGTPKYMSPEQVAGGRTVDHRSDIFSLGCVLYEMWTGYAPFSGGDVSQLMHNITTAEPAAPSRVAPQLPHVADLIISRALAKDPEARYPSATELAADLRAALPELPEAAAAPAAAVQVEATAPGIAPATVVTTTARSAKPGAGERTVVGTGGGGAPLPLSRRFDSSKALARLADPSAKERAQLSDMPKPPGIATRIVRDPSLRLLAAMIAAGVASAIVLARL